MKKKKKDEMMMIKTIIISVISVVKVVHNTMLLMIDDINLTLLAVRVCSAAEEESIVYNAVVGLPSSHYNSFTFDMYSCIKKSKRRGGASLHTTTTMLAHELINSAS